MEVEGEGKIVSQLTLTMKRPKQESPNAYHTYTVLQIRNDGEMKQLTINNSNKKKARD